MNFERLLVFTVIMNILFGIGYTAYTYSENANAYDVYADQYGNIYTSETNTKSMMYQTNKANTDLQKKDIFANSIGLNVFGIEGFLNIPKLIGMTLTIFSFAIFPMAYILTLYTHATILGQTGQAILFGIIIFYLLINGLTFIAAYNKFVNRQQ